MNPELEENRIHDSSFAFDEALKEENGRQQAIGMGVPVELLGQTVEAHGKRWSVGAAISECPPFARMIRAVADNVPETMRSEVLAGTIKGMAEQTDGESVPLAVQKKTAAERAANEFVKKN